VAPAYDVVVIGLGAMGSAAADALARRGARVLGLDRFPLLHAHGSSHGRSRVIREAYFEHPLYVPLVRRAYELWHELERDSGQTLFTRTGLVSLGPGDAEVVAGARRSAREHGIAHENLAPAEVRARWPSLLVRDGEEALFETRAGLLDVEGCLHALQERARRHGAILRAAEPVLEWTPEGGGVRVRTAQAAYAAGAAILSAGAWAGTLLPGLALPLQVERQVVHWFAPADGAPRLTAERCPTVLWEHAPGAVYYTTPDTGHGLKGAQHHNGLRVGPDHVAPPSADDERASRALLARLLPSAAGPLLDARTCLYTNTPDGHFLVGRHPVHAQVVLASPCSGHGFKFATALGEILADLAGGGSSGFDLQPFSPSRLVG
jgi:sarcosine oxidase